MHIHLYVYIYMYVYIFKYIYIYIYIYITQKQDGHNTYVIMKAMCLPAYHQNGFVATQSLGHMMYVITYV